MIANKVRTAEDRQFIEQNRGALVFREIQYEVLLWRSIRMVPPVGKQVRTESRFVGDLEEARRDNLVGVYVIGEQRCHP